MIIVETFERGGAPRGPPSPDRRGQDRDAMTPVTASSHRPPAGERSLPAPQRRCRTGSLRRRAMPPDHRQNRPVEAAAATAPTTAVVVSHRRLRRPAHPSPKPPRRPNRHRRQPLTPPPRVPSLEAFGRRPSVPADRSRPAGIRNPSPKRPFATTAANGRDGCQFRPFRCDEPTAGLRSR